MRVNVEAWDVKDYYDFSTLLEELNFDCEDKGNRTMCLHNERNMAFAIRKPKKFKGGD